MYRWVLYILTSLNDRQSRSSYCHPLDWQPVEIEDDRCVSWQPGIS